MSKHDQPRLDLENIDLAELVQIALDYINNVDVDQMKEDATVTIDAVAAVLKFLNSPLIRLALPPIVKNGLGVLEAGVAVAKNLLKKVP